MNNAVDRCDAMRYRHRFYSISAGILPPSRFALLQDAHSGSGGPHWLASAPLRVRPVPLAWTSVQQTPSWWLTTGATPMSDVVYACLLHLLERRDSKLYELLYCGAVVVKDVIRRTSSTGICMFW